MEASSSTVVGDDHYDVLARLLGVDEAAPAAPAPAHQPRMAADVDILDQILREEGIFEAAAGGLAAAASSEDSQRQLTELAAMAMVPMQPMEAAPPNIIPIPVSDPYLFETSSSVSTVASPGEAGHKTRTLSRSSDEGVELSPPAGLSPMEPIPDNDEEDEDDDRDVVVVPQRRRRRTRHSEDDSPQADSISKDLVATVNAKCLVCKEKAGKHNYYGGRVCPSCRAFFRRAVQSKYYEIFFCTKGESCEINLKTRRSCQYCRFNKCIEAGMRIAWVLPDGERNKRFNKLGKTRFRNKFTDEPMGALKKEPAMLEVGPDELAAIEKTCGQFLQNLHAVYKRTLVSEPGFMRELASLVFFGDKTTFDFYRGYNAISERVIWEMFRCGVNDVTQLPRADLNKLVERNGRLINQVRNAVTVQDSTACLVKGIEYATKNGTYPWLSDINEKLNALQLTDGGSAGGAKEQKNMIIPYETLFAISAEDDARHFALVQRMKTWPRETADGALDSNMFLLLQLVMAFSPEFLELERRDLCERIQWRYIDLLQRYLRGRFGARSSRGRLAEALMMTSYARESEQIQLNAVFSQQQY